MEPNQQPQSTPQVPASSASRTSAAPQQPQRSFGNAQRRGGPPSRGGAGGGNRSGGGASGGGGGRAGGGGRFSRGPRTDNRGSKQETGLKEKVLDLRRVTRVVQGGKRFRFRATIVVGDEKGQVGIGVGKGLDVAQSVGKAKADAAKHMITIVLRDQRTIAHEVYAKYSAAKVLIKPASAGHGLRAGGAVRSVLSLAGVKDATSKILGRTPNKLTNAQATIAALKTLKTRSTRTKREAPAPAVAPTTEAH